MNHLHFVDDLVVPDEPDDRAEFSWPGQDDSCDLDMNAANYAMLQRSIKNQIAIMRYLDSIAGGSSGLAAIVAVSENVLREVAP